MDKSGGDVHEASRKHFEVSWLGKPTNFWGLKLQRESAEVYSLSVKSNIIENLVVKAGQDNAKEAKTPMDQGFLKNSMKSEAMEDSTKYNVGTLMHVAVYARPDKTASTSILGRKFAAPTQHDMEGHTKSDPYLKGTVVDWKLKLGGVEINDLVAYSDAD